VHARRLTRNVCAQLGAGPREHEDLIPVLADLLAFSAADRELIRAAQDGRRGALGLLSSLFG
jgi:hypothetical protein